MGDFFRDLIEVKVLLYAFITGIVASPIFGVVGSFVVARRISYIAAAIAHCILGGIGASIFFERTQGWSWCTPMLGAIVAALLAAGLIGWVTIKIKEREDTLITAIWAFGMAVGVIFQQFTPGKAVNLESYIFGNILLTSRDDMIVTIILAVVILILVGLFYHKLVAVCFDEEFARLRGMKTEAYYFLLLVIVAISMVLLVKLAGIVMSLALLVLPAATASRFSKKLWIIMLLATVLSIAFNTFGFFISYPLDVPPGAFIVVLCSFFYGLSFFLFRKKKRNPSLPVNTD